MLEMQQQQDDDHMDLNQIESGKKTKEQHKQHIEVKPQTEEDDIMDMLDDDNLQDLLEWSSPN